MSISDIDECTHQPCHPKAMCTNEVGSFKCECRSGYSGNGKTCQGIWYEILNNDYEHGTYNMMY